MANARAIIKRRRAVQNISKITRTMQLIATARFQKAHNKVVAARPYTEKLMEMVNHLQLYAESSVDFSCPLLLVPDEVRRIRLLIITSNRGLCGGFNSNVVRAAQEFIKERREEGQDVVVDVVGKKGISHIKYLSIPVERTYLLPDEVPYLEVEKIAEGYINLFIERSVDAVAVAYMRFFSSSVQRPEILQLLPLQLKAKEGDSNRHVNYEYIPSPQDIFDSLLPEAIKIVLYQCFMDSGISEQAARMVAMKTATDNAEEMIKSLTKQANRARQGQITRELSELISGAEALSA